MPKIKYKINLTQEEKEYLEKFVKQGKKSAREITRARILLLANDGLKQKEIGTLLQTTRLTVARIIKNFFDRGLESTLKDKARSGRPREIQREHEAHLVALACSDPPEGSAKWTMRLLADKFIELNLVDNISHMSVQRILKKRN